MTTNPQDLINFFTKVGQLKKIKRTGWVLRGVREPESIADHSFRLALMAWIFGQGKQLDIPRVIKMALVHDLCEVFAGDATPYDEWVGEGKHTDDRQVFNRWPLRLTKEEKERRASSKRGKEASSLEKVVKELPEDLRDEIVGLWTEYEEGLTREAALVRQIDKMENMISACEYQLEDEELPIRSFWVQLKESVDDPDLVKFLEVLDRHYNVSLKK
ncbi:HD domain-containing protein [Candidatus Parcubacteria bacterium]|nr:HD domain-containing protein [Candidatus Parcubacteria bacterium]